MNRIERVRLFELNLPLVHSFETSSHRKTGLTHILVELTDSDGVVGWGEIASPTDPFYSADTVETSWLVAKRYLADLVLGAEMSGAAAIESTWGRIRGHEFAKAGFSIAAWDLAAKAQGISLAQQLGGTRTEVVAGVSLGIEPTIDELLAQVQRQVDAGYRRVKLKIAPGWDLEPVLAVRDAHPALLLHVDANAVYRPSAETTELFQRMDAANLTMIEQPFDVRDFHGHSYLQQQIETPICLDESIGHVNDIETMLRLDAGRVVNIKVSRMGGLGAARAAHDVANDAGVPVWCGGMHEFGIGRAANVAVSSLRGFSLPSDVSGSDKYYAQDIIEPAVVADGGIVQVPTAPGIGHEVREHWITENAQRTEEKAL